MPPCNSFHIFENDSLKSSVLAKKERLCLFAAGSSLRLLKIVTFLSLAYIIIDLEEKAIIVSARLYPAKNQLIMAMVF